MRLLNAGARGIPVILAVLAALAVGAIHVPAADPEKKDEKKDEASEKRYAFTMDGKPWDAVFKWLADETSKPVNAPNKPTGTFSFIGPAKKTYSLPEVIDLINDGLISNSPTNKYCLINGDHSYFVVDAGDKIDPYLLPRLDGPEDLVKHGETELVQLELVLTSLNNEDLAPRLGAIMGPFHESIAMPGNRLILQDTVKNLKRVVKTIKDIQESEKTQTDSYSHECKFIRARDCEKTLRTLLGEPQPVQAPPENRRDRDNPAPQPMGQPMGQMGQPMGQMGQPMGQMGQPMGPPMGQPMFPMGQPTFPQVPSRPTRIRMFYITSDDVKNLVLVTGPPEIIAKAKDIVENRLDKASARQLPVLIGPPSFKNIAVPDGNADGLAKDLQYIFPPSPTLRITAAGTNALRVYACPEDMDSIEKRVLEIGKGVKGVLVPVGGLDPAKAATTLIAMFGDPKTGGPYIEAVPDNDGVLVRGTADQVDQIRQIVRTMNGQDTAPGAPGNPGASLDPNTTRVITLENGSGAAVADELQRILKQMRSNPVKVIQPGGGVDKNEDQKPPIPDMKKAPESKRNAASDVILVAQKPGDGAPLVDPQDKKNPKPEDKPGSADLPIYIAASGNRIIITSQDPAALAMAQQLVRLMTQTTAGEGDFEVIHLKTASAVDAAKLLDQAFNGPTQAAPPQQGNPFGRGGLFQQFAAPGAQTPANPSPNRIRVVADPSTNSLLVRAKPVDMLTVRYLLAKAIDNTDKNTDGPKTRLIGPLKYARASDVSTLLRTIFADQVSQNPTLQDFQRPGSFGTVIAGSQNRNLDINGQPRAVALTIAVDDTSNSLIVNCTQPLYDDVKQLVDQLDLAAKDNTKTVRVVQTTGVDPAIIQQAIDAIQGRVTSGTGSSSNTGGGFQPGGGGFQPGGGGFQPGGGGFQPGGGGFQPGGGQQGGPGRRGRGGNRAPDREGRGPDFFEGRVTDDPQPAIFYDPQHEAAPLKDNADAPVQPARYEEQQPPPAPPPLGGDTIVAPRAAVSAQPLPSLGVMVLIGSNPADVKLIEELIKKIEEISKNAQLKIQLVVLKNADATSVANTLNALYQRVTIGAQGTSLNTTAPQTQQTQQGVTTTQQPLSSVVLVPVPRLNALLVAVPGTRLEEVLQHIKGLDVDSAAAGQTTAIHLKKASAARVGTLLTNFYNQRYAAGLGQEGVAQHQVRITFDTSTNVVFVQAAPADMIEIKSLIEHLDTDIPAGRSNIRIKYLKHAVADNVANLLERAIGNSVAPFVAPPAATGTGTGANAGGTPGGFPGANTGGAPGGFPGANSGGAPGGFPGANTGGAPGANAGRPAGATGATGAASATTPSVTGALTATTKSQTLTFIDPRTGKVVESGVLEDVFILPDENTNSLLISAPDKSMDLLEALIDALDVAPAAQYVVKVVTLKKSDANAVAGMLQQLFLGTGSSGAARTTTPGTTGGVPSATGATGANSTTGSGTPFQLSLNGYSEGVQLTDLRITIDERTNSLVLAGGPSDIDIIQAVIAKLESSPEASDLAMRRNEVYHLKNSTAVDVANALNSFLTSSINVLKTNGLTPFQDVEHEVIVVAEPITNKLLISATPARYGDILHLIEELDAESPQVVIQCLIAEVDLTGNEEFGVELGLQAPVLFQRGIFPAAGLLGPNGSVNFANATGGVITPGVTVNSTINPTAQPGFNFNVPTTPLGNNPSAAGAQVIGTQGLSSLGVGRVSPTSGVSGFVFSAQSDVFNVLVRALKSQGRIDIMSRPQVMTLDNQTASVLVGQSIPYVSSTNVTSTGLVTNGITYRDVGVQMQVTPKISPDGRVIMRVIPEVSSVAPTSISIGNGVTATAFNVQNVTTTVSAEDGQTVAIGGLISRDDEKNENKVPWFGDLPGLGVLFRYRTQTKAKRELLVILTPHIVKTRAEAERVLAGEARRMDWIVGDAVRLHGASGMEPVLHPSEYAPLGGVDGSLPSPLMNSLPPPGAPSTPPGAETLPPPRVAPGPNPPPVPGPGAQGPTPAPVQQASSVTLPPPPGSPDAATAAPAPPPADAAADPARKRLFPRLFPGP